MRLKTENIRNFAVNYYYYYYSILFLLFYSAWLSHLTNGKSPLSHAKSLFNASLSFWEGEALTGRV